jgi:ferredoxin
MSCKRAVAMFPLYRHAESSKNIVKALREDKATSVHHLALHANDSVVDFISREVVLASPVNSPMKLSGVARREVMVDAIRALRTNSGEGIELSEDSTLPLFELTVDDVRCTFCELCQRDCPDHAIEFTKNEDTVALMFDPSLCGGCMICEKNCPERAITLSRLRGLSPILEQKRVAMARDETAKCEKCGAILGPKRSLMSLKKKLSEQGVSDAALRTLGQCIGCRQRALIE